jgi:hypothetical protein
MQLTQDSEYAVNDTGYGGKPKVYYLMEIDELFKKYSQYIILELPTAELRVEAATALIIARFPGKEKREMMWKDYIETTKTKSQLNASINSAASLFTHIAKEFELTSEAFMGF